MAGTFARKCLFRESSTKVSFGALYSLKNFVNILDRFDKWVYSVEPALLSYLVVLKKTIEVNKFTWKEIFSLYLETIKIFVLNVGHLQSTPYLIRTYLKFSHK